MKFCYDLNYKISINVGGLSIDFMIIIRYIHTYLYVSGLKAGLWMEHDYSYCLKNIRLLKKLKYII